MKILVVKQNKTNKNLFFLEKICLSFGTKTSAYLTNLVRTGSEDYTAGDAFYSEFLNHNYFMLI